MKNTFTLLILLLVSYAAWSQTLFKQDFESGIQPMKVVDRSGRTVHPNVGAFPNAWNVANPASGNGTNIAVSTSWFNPPGRADGWMITPKIAIDDPRTVLFWEAKAQDATYPDGYEVRISKTDDETTSFDIIAFSQNRENTSWTKRSISLADYVGDSIHIAWRNNSNDMFLLYVDNIEARVVPENGASIRNLTTLRFHERDKPVQLKGVIENRGSSPLTYIEVTWSHDEESYTDTLDNINVAVGGSYEFTHSTPFVMTEAKTYTIEISIANPNDDEDGVIELASSTMTLSGVSEVPTKRVVIEEGTGTWCGWCPRGFVAMEHMIENYHETFIGIAVHNNDPMVVAAYDNAASFSGYPSANVDRSLKDVAVGLNQFVDFHNAQQREISPLAVNVTAVYNDAGRKIDIEASAKFLTEITGADYRFAVVMVEDSVKGTSTQWAQANFYSFQSQNIPLVGYGFDWQAEPNPVPASRMFYNDVGRALLGGYNGVVGSIASDIEVDQEFSHTFSYTVPNNQNPYQMRAVALVIDGSNGSILNANEIKVDVLSSVKEPVVNHFVNYFPNPAQGYINLDLEVERPVATSLTIYNTLGQQVSMLDLGIFNGQSVRQVDVSKLAPGVYSFVLNLGNHLVTRQVIIQ